LGNLGWIGYAAVDFEVVIERFGIGGYRYLFDLGISGSQRSELELETKSIVTQSFVCFSGNFSCGQFRFQNCKYFW
jgi:hypothetical protein